MVNDRPGTRCRTRKKDEEEELLLLLRTGGGEIQLFQRVKLERIREGDDWKLQQFKRTNATKTTCSTVPFPIHRPTVRNRVLVMVVT